MRILVTGGAGYIGSHTTLELIRDGNEVVVIDNLSSGNRESVPVDATFVNGTTSDGALLDELFTKHKIDVVVHCSAKLVVPESVTQPIEYFQNNTCGVATLLKSMIKNGVRNIVFSSTAAVYGNPQKIPASESDFTIPINPYGASKLACEWLIQACQKAHGINYCIFRYFNVAGADSSGGLGQSTKGAKITHLIPVVVDAALGNTKKLLVYGDDYDTKDGTCVRDYIHVTDLARAHAAGVKFVLGGRSDVFNLGSQYGYSVKEVHSAAEKVLGLKIPFEIAARRDGDPAVLIADVSKVREILGFTNNKSLEEMIRSDYEWRKNPKF